MKNVLLVIFTLPCFGLYLLSAQIPSSKNPRVTLSGHVVTAQAGAPLAGATIFFPDIKTGVASQADGSFIINNIPAGRHLVEISFVGYKSLIEYIDVNGVMTRDFALSPGVVENTGIVITGVSTGTRIKNASIPITIVNRQEMMRAAATNLIDGLSRQPGVTQLTTGPAISKPYIRGLGYNRILTISNDVRQEGQQWGDEHGIEVDDYNVDRVEILKGPASLMYGSDGLAGVINIISNTPVPQGTVTANINSNYQTNNGLYAWNGNVAGNLHGFNWNVYGTYKAAHDYKNKFDGYVFNSKFNNSDFGASAGLNKSWGYSHLTYSLFSQKLGLIEGERDEVSGRFVKISGPDVNGNDSMAIAGDPDFRSYDPYLPRQKITHQKLVLDNVFYLPGEGGHLSLTVGWQLNQRREFEDVTAPDLPALDFRLRSLTYDVKYFLPSYSKWQTTLGISGMQQENENLGDEVLIPAYALFDIGAFIYTKKNYNRLTLSGGARYDHRNINSAFLEQNGLTKFSAFEKNFGNVSASLGAAFDMNSTVTARINVSRGFRAPNIAELGANGVHEGTIKYEYGNTGLKSETSLQSDIGIDLHTEHVSLTASLFYNNIQNYIFSRKINAVAGGDSIPVEGNEDGFSAFKYFQTTANLYGAEFMFDLHPHPLDWLHYKNTLSYVRGVSGYKTDSTENLPAIPAARWLSEVQVECKHAGKSFQNAYIRLELDATFAQKNIFSAYQTETFTPGYTLLNFSAGSDIVNKKKETLFGIYLSANNITDVAYQNHLSRLKYAPVNAVTGRSGVYNMGRNFSIKVNVPLRVCKHGTNVEAFQ